MHLNLDPERDFERFHKEERDASSFWHKRTLTRRECGTRAPSPHKSGALPQLGDRPDLATFHEAVQKLLSSVDRKRKEQLRVAFLSGRVLRLERRLAELSTCESFVVPINTFAPEPFELLQEMRVVVQKIDEDEYSATFYDANIGTAGCNPTEAVENLKDILLSRFEFLNSLNPEKLAPGPTKQLAVLRAFIRKR